MFFFFRTRTRDGGVDVHDDAVVVVIVTRDGGGLVDQRAAERVHVLRHGARHLLGVGETRERRSHDDCRRKVGCLSFLVSPPALPAVAAS